MVLLGPVEPSFGARGLGGFLLLAYFPLTPMERELGALFQTA